MAASFTRPATSVIDYSVPGGNSTKGAAEKQDVAINYLFTSIKDASATDKGLMSTSDYSKLLAAKWSLTALTGGASGALDELSVADLNDGDIALVNVSGVGYVYKFDAAGTDAESSPDVIRPDDYATAGIWELQTAYQPDASASSKGIASFDSDDFSVSSGTVSANKLLQTTESAVLRIARLDISDGTDANTIKCALVSEWNGDAIAETDNVAAGATVGNFTLSASGDALDILASGLSGNALASGVVGFWIDTSTVGTEMYSRAYVNSNNIRFEAHAGASGANIDLTSEIGTGRIRAHILYITSE